MIIFPAIDLMNGEAVRLRQGEEKTAKKYSQDPAAVALRWQAAGASFLHVVNLDGAFGRKGENAKAIESIFTAVQIPLQLGGGIRNGEDIDFWLAMGIQRVILGTMALKQPQLLQEAINNWGAERIVVGIDARQNKVAVSGWVEQTERDAVDFARQMRKLGVARVVYTDVQRDGEQMGPNIAATLTLASTSGLKVIASGGFSALHHFEALASAKSEYIEGAIVGTALYEGKFDLKELIDCYERRGLLC
ncbi:MAG: 1-(5-phosphoribosyl)-5-[(5-phosphoribosylamino)methylideneamino]imidazole-4-carboxamide isomerase [Calditrichaeota bacterium]|nr:MAG: 1-(5-phosphoribosyl)-5-[(5-phosphoribosylamino)methylideneamino]imidazole-4-carboxamide isomerase [Calditrichota bacterium]